MIEAGMIALLAESVGLAIGTVLLYLFKIKSKRMIGMLFGATSGLMIAVICFDILPEGLAEGTPTLVLLGIMIGVGLGVGLEILIDCLEKRQPKNRDPKMRMGILLIMGIALHNIPEGFALGTLCVASKENLVQFSIILALHSIPEGIAISIPLKEGGAKLMNMMGMCFVLGTVMGISACASYVISQSISGFISIAMGLASGIILYIVCQELLPESRKVWNGRLTALATIIGIIGGMLLLY